MKKKLKDVTYADLLKQCDKHISCKNCPFDNYCGSCITVLENIKNDLEKEIEL